MSDYSALQTQLDDNSYQHTILQDVSRTFALTIPQLPDPLSHVVGNAYLLCRIADTIEDDKHMQADIKREFAEMFTEVVAGQCDVDKFSKSLFPLLSSEASEAEHNLIANTAPVIRITHSFNQRQRAALQRCVSIMAEGMVRYQDTETLDGVNNLEDMGQYCYYVAGVVGEMLTELFCDYSEEIDQQYRIGEQVIRNARVMTREGATQVTMRLDPQELGEVTIRLTTQDQVVSGEIAVESQKVQEIVQRNMGVLRDALAGQGIQLENIDVSVQDRGAQPDRETFRENLEERSGEREEQEQPRSGSQQWEQNERQQRQTDDGQVDFMA